jgi:HAD superfamily phosphatase (TIGR01668 family)
MLLRPDQYVTDVCATDLAALRAAGVRAVLLDIDNTVMPLHSAECPDPIFRWVTALKDEGFAVAFVSNTWQPDVDERMSRFDCPVTPKSMKPLARGFRAAARVLGVSTRQCAVVGDQIFTDVLGGNLVGATTILVQPLSTSDLPHTVALRYLERLIMAGRVPSSECREA